jgi:ankyrin repeat protein
VIEHGADVCAVTSNGETALHSVCDLSGASDPKMAQRLEIIQVLLDHGANINARYRNGSTPLHASWSCAQHTRRFGPDLLNLLLEIGAGRPAADKDKRTPADLVDLAK